jgi:acyl-CoA thioesterase
VFAAPVPAGPVTIDVEVLRRGRSLSQATATVRGEGADAGHATMAVFGRARTGFALTDRRCPDVPPPGECPSFRDEGPRDDSEPFEVPFWDHIEGRPAMGHAPWEDYVPERSDCAFWYRFDHPPRRADGTLDPLALVTLCDTMPSSVGERMGPDMPPGWWAPSADLTVHLLGESRSEWVLAHLRAHRAGEGYASGEVAIWDPEAGLAAFATQVMIFTFDEPPDPAKLVPADQRPR